MRNCPRRGIVTLVIEIEAMRWLTKKMSRKEKLPLRKSKKTKNKREKTH